MRYYWYNPLYQPTGLWQPLLTCFLYQISSTLPPQSSTCTKIFRHQGSGTEMPTKSGCRKCKSPCAQPKPAPKPIPQEMLGLHRIISDTHGSAGLLQNQLFSRTLDQLQRALNQKHETNISEHLQKSLNQRTNAS